MTSSRIAFEQMEGEQLAYEKALAPILISKGYRPILDRKRTPKEVENIVQGLLDMTGEYFDGLDYLLDRLASGERK